MIYDYVNLYLSGDRLKIYETGLLHIEKQNI